MITETSILEELEDELGEIFPAFPANFYLKIVKRRSLRTFSTYYPKIVRGIYITENEHIPTDIDDTLRPYVKYRIPKADPDAPFIGIEIFYHPLNPVHNTVNEQGGGTFGHIAAKATSSMHQENVLINGVFQGPDIIELTPPTSAHIDFTVDMLRKLKLHEVPYSRIEDFYDLVGYDVKRTIYNKYRSKLENAYRGQELKSALSEYGDANGERRELIEKFENDYYKNPERFASMLTYSRSY